MFLNLKNAGETEVKDDMPGGYHVGTGSILSDPQFADVANRQTGIYSISYIIVVVLNFTSDSEAGVCSQIADNTTLDEIEVYN